MKKYWFEILNNKIIADNGVVDKIPPGFDHYEHKTFGLEQIYYKLDNGKVVEIICEGHTLQAAKLITEQHLPLFII